MRCESENYKPNICIVKELEAITNVTVSKLVSDSSCTLYDGLPEGEYGFNDTHIWVDYGCRANFTVCGYPGISNLHYIWLKDDIFIFYARN